MLRSVGLYFKVFGTCWTLLKCPTGTMENRPNLTNLEGAQMHKNHLKKNNQYNIIYTV